MSESHKSEPPRTRLGWRIAPAAALFILTVSLYLPSLRNDFVYDDHELILNHPAPRSLADVWRVFTEPHFPKLPYYRPLARLTMVGQKFLHGDQPTPFHLFNALVMGTIAVLAYALYRSPGIDIAPGYSFLAAMLLAAHPIASSCVYPICSGRETSLPAVFAIAAVCSFLRHGAGWRAGAWLLFAAALLCKEQAAVVPGLFALADLLHISADPPGRSLRRWLLRYAPVAAVLMGYFAIRWRLFGGAGSHAVAVFEQPWGPPLAVLFTLQSTFAPFAELVYEPTAETWLSPWRALIVLAVVAIFALATSLVDTAARRRVAFWVGWFVLALLPTSNLLTQEAPFDERYGLLSLVAVAGAASTLATALSRRLATRAAMVVSAVVLMVACATITVHRARYFRDDVAFTTQWSRTDPSNYKPQSFIAYCYTKQGMPDRAAGHYRRAIAIHPQGYALYNNLGLLLAGHRRFAEAEAEFRRAIHVKPEKPDAYNNLGVLYTTQGRLNEAIAQFEIAMQRDPAAAQARSNLGAVLVSQGRLAEAETQFAQIARGNPHSAEAHYKLGHVLAREGKFAQARARLMRAIRIKPDYADAHYTLALVYSRQQRLREAAASYRRVLELAPDHLDAAHNLAWILATSRDRSLRNTREALHWARRAAEATGHGQYRVLDTLAASLAANGQFDEAQRWQAKAMMLAPESEQALLRARYELYQSRKTVH